MAYGGYQWKSLTFAGCNERVYHDLGAIVEIAELRFPNDQILRIVDGHSVLESEDRLFR